MRVLYLRTYFNFNLKAGGSVGHTAGVINALSRKAEIKVVSNDYLPGVEPSVDIIKPFKLRLGLINNLLEIFYNFKLLSVLKPTVAQYDFIYHRYTGNSFVASKLAKSYSVPLILEFNSSAYWAIKNWTIRQSFPKNILRYLFNHLIRLPLTKLIERYNLKYATLIVVVSSALKESLITTGIPEEKILVNPNGVNPEVFSNHISGIEVRTKYNIPKNRLVFGFIGTFGQWHGAIELAKAIILFYDNYPEELNKTLFMFIGDGILFDQVKNIIKASEYAQQVILTGLIPQQEAPEYLAACDIFLSPHIKNPDGSRFFGSPTKLFEYMAMGKPIIASKLEQIGEILTHNKDALLVPPGNIASLSKAMKTLSDNETLREKLGKEARKNVLNHYTWDKHVERILVHFQQITHLS